MLRRRRRKKRVGERTWDWEGASGFGNCAIFPPHSSFIDSWELDKEGRAPLIAS